MTRSYLGRHSEPDLEGIAKEGRMNDLLLVSDLTKLRKCLVHVECWKINKICLCQAW